MLTLTPADDRRENLNARTARQVHDLIDNLVDRLLADLFSAFRAMRDPDPRPEKSQIVIDLRDGPYSGARVFGSRFLVNGDGRRQAVNVIHIGLVHLPKKHTRIGTETFNITSLPFGIDRVKSQA